MEKPSSSSASASTSPVGKEPSSSSLTPTITRGRARKSNTIISSKVEGKGLKKGPWTAEEDQLLADFIRKEGEGRWRTLPQRAGLLRCGKSCRLRWMNYLRPNVKRGHIAPDEEDLILRLHRLLGNRWSLIAGRIPGRTDNEIKNYWNTHLSKKLLSQGIDPRTHKPLIISPTDQLPNPNSINMNYNDHPSQTPTTPTNHPLDYNNNNNNNVNNGNTSDRDADLPHQYSTTNHDPTTFHVPPAIQPIIGSQLRDPDHDFLFNYCGYGDGVREDDHVVDNGVFSSFLNSLINMPPSHDEPTGGEDTDDVFINIDSPHFDFDAAALDDPMLPMSAPQPPPSEHHSQL